MGPIRPMGERYDEAELFPSVPPELDEYICDYVDGTMDPAMRNSFEEYLAANPHVAEHIETLVRASDMLRSCADQCPCVTEDFQTRLRCAVEHECTSDDPAATWLDRISSLVLVTSALSVMCLAVLAPSHPHEPGVAAKVASNDDVTQTASSASVLLSRMAYHADRPAMVRLGPSTPALTVIPAVIPAVTATARTYPNFTERSPQGAYLASHSY